MAQKKEEVKKKEEALEVPSMEKELEEIKKEFMSLMEFFIPPKEVRKEVLKNIYSIPLPFLKIMRTLLDYQIKLLEERIKEAEEEKKQKSRRIEIE